MVPVLLLLLASAVSAAPRFERDILPILEKNCAKCHTGTSAMAGLDVHSRAALAKGGSSGAAISVSEPGSSLLVKRVESKQMPPGGPPLSAKEIQLLRDWIAAGAPADSTEAVTKTGPTARDRQHWAFQKPVRPAVPKVAAGDRVRTPVDAFVLARLEQKGLSISVDAQALTLLRRVTYDLTGLPPTPADIESFSNDRAAGAYERYVDRLLASPRYAERWARHWLDGAGYADSEGVLAADVVRGNAWRYRDYVIRSLAADKPFDQFVREQLAGDEISEYYRYNGLPAKVVDSLEATGFLRTAVDATRDDFLPKDFAEYQWRTFFDTEQIVASSLLGITIQCARCHDHKYEPFTQRDYYSLQAVFAGALRPTGKVLPSYKRLIVEATKEEQQKAQKNNEPLEKIAKALRELQDGLRGRYRNQHPKGDKATEADLRQSFPEYCRRADEILVEVAEAESKLVKLPTIRALYDQDAAPPVTHILKRGDPLKPGDPVEPGVPAVIDDPEKPFRVPVPDKDAKTTGRRRAFAEWVTSEENPLAARVFVNKVWAAYFGTGIVATLDNFGRSGMAPSHPELLDWLATEFMRQGWSMKKLHRLIVTSTAYRQASALRNEAFAADPDNRLLWRMSPRRLDAEPVRDGVLSAAGTLNPAMYGDPVAATTKKSGEVSPQGEALDGRRSVYQIVRRSAPQNFLNAFDAPVMEINCTRRARSTTATQALAMMNGDFISAQAAHFAHRLTEERLTEADALRRAFVIAYGRAPSAQEIDLSASFLARQAKHYSGKPEAERTERSLADLCQVLLASNEFVYLD